MYHVFLNSSFVGGQMGAGVNSATVDNIFPAPFHMREMTKERLSFQGLPGVGR